MAILCTWDCSTEHNTYAGTGATIVLTAVLASLSGGYALWTVFQSYRVLPATVLDIQPERTKLSWMAFWCSHSLHGCHTRRICAL
jgi:hypothetical protein